MRKGKTEIHYHGCTMAEVQNMINNKQAYPVIGNRMLKDSEWTQKPKNYLIDRTTNEDDTITERTFFFDYKDREDIISWIEDEYTGLFYTL